MRIAIGIDNTIPLHIPSFMQFFHTHSKFITLHEIGSKFRFESDEVSYNDEISKFSQPLRDELKSMDMAIFATAIPYENNYFFEGIDDIYILSLSGWSYLTGLPMSNGVAYLICQIIIKYQMQIGGNHDNTTGCINDFFWDKTGIDIGMRTAFVCDRCKTASAENEYLESQEFKEITSILNSISSACRRDVDILSDPETKKIEQNTLKESPATFLCHNNQDKAQVRTLNEALKNVGIRTWLDEEQIGPGDIWQKVLEDTISGIGSCLIIVGNSGLGPWQDIERRAFISEFANRNCKIIPVIIGNPERPPELPLFLKQFQWADLRNPDGRQLAKLISALQV
ncbi:toll/interleukin-1 receptor domain-containing protein [Hyphococcus flavus]|uniref:Toll/interleukin-1 receptor domain-containing protein n=1 Tax=Hyphococcus flavus TaxID=1866326 RepID=A0AAE9ZBS0_9PROT|nr:toll/interleukin-1 receptor domain-containing protein [Hyphococcus flavus]WDI31276.1 toll/interleukin-1 receptor domain-containing protein [Hyphococcus flavus]